MPTRATTCPDPAPPAVPALPGALEPDWLEDGTPYSAGYGDVYYTRGEGAAEARHVFLEGNALPMRWRVLPDDPRKPFVLAETGFGTGLNFLLARQLWRACAPPQARLLYRSLELAPLSREAMARALAAWPGLAAESPELLDAWPPALTGLHTLAFEAGRVTLQLFVGEAGVALEEFQGAVDGAAVDAWFLDGFAPARNPAIWRSEILTRIAALTRPGGTFATFTAAAEVRRGMAAAGFAVRKVPGFGRKREMLVGERNTEPANAPPAFPALTPWHRAAMPPPAERAAIVIGAGIAGCLVARALAERGWTVTVLEAGDGVAHGASGNPQGILFTQLPAADSAHGEFTLASYLHACRLHAQRLGTEPAAFGAGGLLCLREPADAVLFDKLRARFAALPELVRFVDRAEASQIAGVAVAAEAAYLPHSGWIDPRRACAIALDHAAIALQTGTVVTALKHDGQRWTLRLANGRTATAPAVILANALAASALLPEGLPPLQSVRGQISLLPQAALPGTPRVPISGEGYVVPPLAGLASCGASFQRGADTGEPSATEHAANLARVAALLPDFDACGIPAEALAGRVGLRCASRDRLPIAGRVPDPGMFRLRFATLRENARRPIAQPGAWLPGLALSIAHGSRGLTSAPLCAELVAAELSGEPLPVTTRVARALSPARFLLRAIVRGEDA